MFDLPPAAHAERAWEARLPLEDRPWHVGLVVGPSGSGKTSVARALFADALGVEDRLAPWPAADAILDVFPPDLPIKAVVRLLASIGFSSPPAWLRPYHTLSTGEQFRARLARLLAYAPDVAVVDEFTSAVDRAVARVGSAALARTVRALGKRFVAVTCHEDVEAWLVPDWVYRPAAEAFAWRRLRRRPAVELEVCRCRLEAWELFRPHHYLSGRIHPSAQAFLALWEGRPVAFSAWVNALVKSGGRREHRTVTLPDYQGVGIGHALATFCAALYRTLGHRVRSTTGHPALIAARLRSPDWRLTRPPSLARPPGAAHRRLPHAYARLTTGFEYVGPGVERAVAEAMAGARGDRMTR
jgi:GNAT superfamily N-acetyltransferase